MSGTSEALFGGKVNLLPLRAENGFLPRLSQVPESALVGAKLLFLNYPHNPTGAVAGLPFYEEAVAFARQHGLVLVSDLAYSEITFDGFVAPSVLQVPGARDVAIELHSFSKSFNMAGSRVGFAVGNPGLIDALYAVRTNMGYGTPAAIQEGAVVALQQMGALTKPIAARYQARRDVVLQGFRKLGFVAEPPKGSMFVWLPVPKAFTSQQWTEHLIEKSGVVVTPGNAFGPGGEGYFRVSLVAEAPVLQGAIERLATAGIRFA
jgi:LL-diaminopimelate aminotransferase